MRRRGADIPIDSILEMDSKRRTIIVEADDLRAKRNSVSRELGQTKEKPSELIEEMRGVSNRVRELEAQIREVESELNNELLQIPNIPDDDVPEGESEDDNVVVRSHGDLRTFDFTPLPHWDLAEKSGLIDFQRGVKIAGTRFFVMKGKAVKLQRALITWMTDLHTDEHGYEELYLPFLASRESALASGHLPKYEEIMYHDEEDDFWLVPTAELPVTNMFRDEILDPGFIPAQFVAHTPCFRRERTAAGRDTRGIKRVHQFEKVEMYKFVEPEESAAELDKLVADAEDVCRLLEIPYRVLQLCTADLGATAVKTFDIEMWAPGSEEWLEVSSCSNCNDYQARRASIRYRPEAGARPRFVHTLNGSGLALPRVMIAVMENYQQADGSIIVPEVLRPYTRFDVIE